MFTQEIHHRINLPNGYLGAMIIKPKEGKSLPVIVFLTGSGSVKERYQDIQYYFSAKGYYTIAFDFRGRGESSGNPGQNTLRDQQYDLKHVISFLSYHQPVDLHHLMIVGTSMGAFVAASIADELPVSHLVLSAPALYLPEHELLPQSQLNHQAATITHQNRTLAHRSSGLTHLSRFPGNLLILEHEHDTIIPQWLCQQYYQSANQSVTKSYQLLRGVEHSVLIKPAWRQLFSDTIYSWLSHSYPDS